MSNSEIKLSPSLKVGFLTILAIVVLIIGLMWLKGRAISAGERIEVHFNDIDGMRPGSAVQMMGIRIGQVEDVIPQITDDSSYVNVKFVITEPNVKIPPASTISVQQSGIIGEKFIEITPPRTQTVYLPVYKNFRQCLNFNDDVKILAEGNKYIKIGKVRNAEIIKTRTLPLEEQIKLNSIFAYQVDYMVTKAGVVVPQGSNYDLEYGSTPAFKIIPPTNIIVKIPDSSLKYTIEEPMRLKDFMDIQMKAALALNETNNKINSILSDDSVANLKDTIQNIKVLTAKANTTIDKASLLLDSSRTELGSVISIATELSNKVISLTDKVDNIVGDKGFQNDIKETTSAVNKSTTKISKVLENSKLEETLVLLNSTAKDVSEISGFINEVTKDKELKQDLNLTVNNLNKALDKLTVTIDAINKSGLQDDNKIKAIIDDTSKTSANLKKFTEKLNKRFALFRLMF